METSNEPTAVVEFEHGIRATLTGDGWRCADEFLSILLSHYGFEGRVSPSHPNPISEVAHWAAEELGGKVIQEPPTDFDPEVVY